MNFKEILCKTPQPILWHYTNLTGLSGILSSNTLRLTHIQMQNDKNEQIEAVEMFREELNKKKVSADEVHKLIQITGQSRVCTMSFSEHKDLLSQWRGYASGTHGFAIGFNANKLKEIAEKNKCQFVPCIYDKNDKIKLISNCIEDYNLSEYNKSKIVTTFLLAAELPLLTAIMKSDKFIEEGEWRLIKYSNIDTATDSNYQILPGENAKTYWQLKVEKPDFPNLIEHIICGPNYNFENTKLRVEEMLLISGFSKLPMDDSLVSKSKIPLR